MDRPLAWVAAGFAAGMWCAAGGSPAMLAASLLLGTLFGTSLFFRLPHREHFGMALLFFFTGALLWTLSARSAGEDPLSSLIAAHPTAEFSVEGRVRHARLFLPGLEYTQFLLDVDTASVDGQQFAVRGRAVVRWTGPVLAVHDGERLRVRGGGRLRLGPVNHDTPGYEDWLRTQGVRSELRIRDAAVEKLGMAWWSPWYWGARLRQWEADMFRRYVPPDVLPFLLTVWLGESGQISGKLNDAFIASGTAHVLSVSGVHVSILFVSLQFVLRSIPSRRKRALVMMLLVGVFAVATGGRVATLRAAMMIELHLAAGLLRRESDTPTTLSLSALVFLALNPDSLFDAGFLLSFSSVASLLLFTPEIERGMSSWPAWARHAFAPALAVQLLPLPIALHYFHVLPLVSPLANLVVIPLLSAVLWLAFGTVVAAVVLGYAAILLGHAIAPLVWLVNAFVLQTLQIPHANPVLTSPSGLSTLAYYAAVAALYAAARHPRHRRTAAVVFTASIVTMVFAWNPIRPITAVDFLDVGHGDATCIRTPEAATVLVDGGDASEYGDSGARIILPFLYTQGITRLDLVVVTHADRDHLGGLFEVLRRMEVGQVLMGPESREALEQQFLALCADRGVPVRRVHAGERFTLGGADIEALHPPDGWRPDLPENEQSLVLRISWPGMRLLMTGDIEQSAERLLAAGDCSANLLKVPHHGSDTSSTSAFLRAVSPEVAVMSVLPRGNFRTGSPEVAARYKKEGTRLFRTDEDGGIRVTVAPGGLSVSAARRMRGW